MTKVGAEQNVCTDCARRRRGDSALDGGSIPPSSTKGRPKGHMKVTLIRNFLRSLSVRSPSHWLWPLSRLLEFEGTPGLLTWGFLFSVLIPGRWLEAIGTSYALSFRPCWAIGWGCLGTSGSVLSCASRCLASSTSASARSFMSVGRSGSDHAMSLLGPRLRRRSAGSRWCCARRGGGDRGLRPLARLSIEGGKGTVGEASRLRQVGLRGDCRVATSDDVGLGEVVAEQIEVLERPLLFHCQTSEEVPASSTVGVKTRAAGKELCAVQSWHATFLAQASEQKMNPLA